MAGDCRDASRAVFNPGMGLGARRSIRFSLRLRLRQDGLIPAARPVLDTLRQAGMYLSDRVIDKALMFVGE